ncbi:MAG: cobalt ECF transporter T component CbiQ, partial [Paraclostridium sp.]
SIFINLINISVDNDNLTYSIKVINMYLGVSSESILNSIHLFLRSIACIVCVYFFILTTPFNDLINVLKKIHISDTLIELIMLTYRFIFIFLEEVEEIYKSQQLKFGYINLKNSYKSTGLMINMLFLRLIKRYEDMSIALDIKMYDGKFHV